MRNMRIKLFLSGLLLAIFLTPMAVYGLELDVEGTLLNDNELPAIYMTTSSLNLRPTPCTTNPRLALAQPGSRVEVVDYLCGEWFAVVYSGIAGYMYAEWLMPWPDFSIPAMLGTVELIEWSQARNIMTIGTPATVIDVRTGLTWQIASFSNGNHADVETLTAEDTAIMKQAWGGRWCWTPRPVVVIINGRTLAASLNGMPHAGWTRAGNNMNGHVCLHFLGSRTHNGTVSHERDHQAAVQEAYNTASNW
ncbi:MAG: SH3 domain-containing protein [Defluviitaleaceae bacterium]|nr:SH3 domain-containing protein [Defluviitaleaceae bacterium]